ncbi:hypothetical protein UFOVP402_18 [uncultured Caudovirales phage]|uniref:Uncharacterized protein n=1 Tax=uncultured Caudovirales phage TaxID=2100421 RepID=A0A6J5M469_9CAUD|nr:hypothetical protein UFOVP402_18 [uncultured Caudovirales phage]
MMRCVAAGESVRGFYENTIAENIVVIRAKKDNEGVTEQRLRTLMYVLSLPHIAEKDRKDIYEWMPLPGDPTPEERKAMQEKAMKKEFDQYEEIFKRMRSK